MQIAICVHLYAPYEMTLLIVFTCKDGDVMSEMLQILLTKISLTILSIAVCKFGMGNPHRLPPFHVGMSSCPGCCLGLVL